MFLLFHYHDYKPDIIAPMLYKLFKFLSLILTNQNEVYLFQEPVYYPICSNRVRNCLDFKYEMFQKHANTFILFSIVWHKYHVIIVIVKMFLNISFFFYCVFFIAIMFYSILLKNTKDLQSKIRLVHHRCTWPVM